jgi:hypothetical protein
MEKITINLLPEEFLVEKKLGAKRSLYLRISIIVFVAALIITSSILLLRLTQSQTLQSLEGEVDGSKNNISGLKENETAVFMLKNRLDKITQLSSKESVPVQSYNLFSKIVPSGVNISSFSMIKENIITATIETSDTAILDKLFENLLDPSLNEGHITNVKLENIRLQGNKITIEMTIGYNAKGAPAAKAT